MKKSKDTTATTKGAWVNIANFKSQLAKYLRMVQVGQEVVVTDHKRPVARIIPYEASGSWEVIKAKGNFSDVAGLRGHSPKKGPIDSLALLLEERGKR